MCSCTMITAFQWYHSLDIMMRTQRDTGGKSLSKKLVNLCLGPSQVQTAIMWLPHTGSGSLTLPVWQPLLGGNYCRAFVNAPKVILPQDPKTDTYSGLFVGLARETGGLLHCDYHGGTPRCPVSPTHRDRPNGGSSNGSGSGLSHGSPNGGGPDGNMQCDPPPLQGPGGRGYPGGGHSGGGGGGSPPGGGGPTYVGVPYDARSSMGTVNLQLQLKVELPTSEVPS
jgi:hypothetical protein